MRYLIGDVARTLGLTPGALHFFEREGVIPSTKAAGTRRTYGTEEIVRLISYKKYRGMEMPLKEIARQFSPDGNTCAQIGEKLERQHGVMLETARRYTKLAEGIRWLSEQIADSEGKVGQITRGDMPPRIALRVGGDGLISRDRAEQKRVASWLEYMPACHVSSFADGRHKVGFGYSMRAEACEDLGLLGTPGAERLEAPHALHAYLMLGWEYYRHPSMAFEPLWRCMEEQGLTPCGRGVAVNLCVQSLDNRRDTLVSVWVPYEAPEQAGL